MLLAQDFGQEVSIRSTDLDMGISGTGQKYFELSGTIVESYQFGCLVSAGADSISAVILGPGDSGLEKLGYVSMDYAAGTNKIRVVQGDYGTQFVMHYCFSVKEDGSLEKIHTAISRMTGNARGDSMAYPFFFQYMDGVKIAPPAGPGMDNDALEVKTQNYWDYVGELIPEGRDAAFDNIQELAQGASFWVDHDWTVLRE